MDEETRRSLIRWLESMPWWKELPYAQLKERVAMLERSLDHPYKVVSTGAGLECTNCGHGFECWLGADISPCRCAVKKVEEI